MIGTVATIALLIIAVGKTRGNSSMLQQFVLWAFIACCMTYLGVLTWQSGRPTLDADGTRQRIIERLKVDDNSN